MAVTASPGMPKTSAGIHALDRPEFMEDVAPISPSLYPVPNSSGVRENRREMP